jgi:hypothetical protein
MRLLQEAFKAEFERVLDKDRLTRTEAARRLKVSRQAFHAYLSEAGSIPRKDVLRRIVELWPDFHVVAGGHQVFDKDSVAPTRAGGPTPVPQQLELFEVLKELKQENLEINVKRVKKDTQIFLTIKIPA